MDWLGARTSPFRGAAVFSSERFAEGDAAIDALCAHPLDALLLHGDDQVRRLLRHWDRLPAHVRRHLADRDALATALSKERSIEVARRAGVAVLPTTRCATPEAVARAGERLAPGGEVVLKGEGGSAGSTVRALRAGATPGACDWKALTANSSSVLVQRRITGRKMLVTVVYEHGAERAACVHEKVDAFPEAFGISAHGVTRRLDELLDSARRILSALFWHGPANVEFRQDRTDGCWYFMEINPRIASSIGIQQAAGQDVVGAWAAVCAGRGVEEAPGRAYRAGVQYAWTVPALALAMRRPLAHGAKAARVVMGTSDWKSLDRSGRASAMRVAAWLVRNR